MPRKKAVKKKSVRKNSSKVVRMSVGSSKKRVRSSPKKIRIAVNNLVLFVVLSLVSYGLYGVSGSEFYQNLFFLSSMILGFIALAFLIVLAILLILKGMRK